MRKIRQVLEYRLSKGLSADQTAQALSLSKGSVINYLERFKEAKLRWPLPEALTDTQLEAALFPPPPASADSGSKSRPDIDYLERELARPHVTLQRLYEEYAENHPNGLKRTAFYDFFSESRPPKITMHVEHKGGDRLYCDYSGDGLEYINRTTGEIVEVSLFVCAWGASSYTYAEGTETERTPDFAMSHVRALAYFGVAPKAFVPDNTKSAVKKADRYDPISNPVYGEMSKHYNVAFLPARVCEPQDKAPVESAVLQAQHFILARLRNRQFFSLVEVNDAVREELEALNSRPMKDYGDQTRRQRFEALDKPNAQALPDTPFKITRIKNDVRVAPNYHVRYDNHFYSVPYTLVGKHVCIYQVGVILELYHDGVHLCRHQLGKADFGYTTIPEHMPANHAFVKGWSKEWFITKALEIGPATAEAVTHVMEKREHVQQGYNAALGLLRLAKNFSALRLEAACRRAGFFKSISYRTIKTILEQKLDTQTLLLPAQDMTPLVHENIRGPRYYTNP
jgi:transposase